MPMKKYKPEQIVTLLRQVEVELANGKTTPQACKEAEITAFLPHFLGAHRSEWRLLPKRVAALWEGPNAFREEPGKQKTRSCRTQELA